MKKKIILVFLIIIGLFIITGCDNKLNNNKTESSSEQKSEVKSLNGYYEAYEVVQYGVKSTGDDVKKENITLLINDDKTASLSWGDSSPKLYKIEKNQFIEIDGNEVGNYTYKNGILKLELEGESGFSISFKK